jgi:seryl-tRNA synthetase
MLELRVIREKQSELAELYKVRNQDFSATINEVVVLDDKRKATQAELDDLLAEQNKLAKEIGLLFKSGKQAEANELKTKTASLKEESIALKATQAVTESKLQELLYVLPNIPNPLVPAGKSDQENVEIFAHGQKPTLHEGAVPHWELASQYKLIDFELGVKIAGAGFPVYTGKGARLQRALISFFLSEAEKAGYTEIMPPLLVNEASGYGTGQLPDKEGQMYHATEDNLYLIPTAEVPITNIYRDVILKESDFPIKMTGYTPCFRREAGSYGKDVRGLNRLHQFDKVEIVQIQHPDKSYEALGDMTEYVKGLLTKLELPFRTVRLCGGDLGFTSALTYDMEVYSAAQEKWLEVSSISNFETFQANRLKCRFKNSDGKTQLCHTLNGSALALPRILAALLENNQTPEGIKVPKALVPFTGFEWIK